MSHLPLLL